MKNPLKQRLLRNCLLGLCATLMSGVPGFSQVAETFTDLYEPTVASQPVLTLSQRGASEQRDRLFQELESLAAQSNSHLLLVRNIVKTTKPTVVHIEAKKNTKQAGKAISSDSTNRSVVEEAGSGIILRYRDTTFVVTNYHVVESSEINEIRIEADGKVFYPSRVEHDAATDLSILVTDRNDLIPARIGDSSQVEIGDFVVAIGSPFGLSHSVSYGIISARAVAIWIWVPRRPLSRLLSN